MNDEHCVHRLNLLLKSNQKKQIDGPKEVHSIAKHPNQIYIETGNHIAKKYIDGMIKQFTTNDSSDAIYNVKCKNEDEEIINRVHGYERENKLLDIELTLSANRKVNRKKCKVFGKNLYEAQAGCYNEIKIETLDDEGMHIYDEDCKFEAFIKSKEVVDQLHYLKETSSDDEFTNMKNEKCDYSTFINNNLYSKYVHEKHMNAVNADYSRYNINSIYVNYKNLPLKKVESEHLQKNEENLFELYKANIEKQKVQNELNENAHRSYAFIQEETEVEKAKKQSVNQNVEKYEEPYIQNNSVSKNHKKNIEKNREKLEKPKWKAQEPNYKKTDMNHWNEAKTSFFEKTNAMYNETMRKGYMFENQKYNKENQKLVENSLQCNIRDLKNGTYVVSFTVRKSGYYYLSIFYEYQHVANSPYVIYVMPSMAHASNCIVYKNAHHKILQPIWKMKRIEHKKCAKQKKRRQRYNSKEFSTIEQKMLQKFKLGNYSYDSEEAVNEYSDSESYASQESNESIEKVIYSTKNNKDSSSNENTITTDSESSSSKSSLGNHIDNDPLKKRKKEKGPDMNILECLEEEEEYKERSNFFIESYDAYNNKIHKGKEQFEVVGLGNVKICEVRDLHNGIYEVIYKYIKHEHTYREIQVTLNGCHIKGSPFRIILKNDKNRSFFKKLQNILPISDINVFNPEQNLLNIMKSFKYIKENYIEGENKTLFMSIYPFYKHKEINRLLKKIDDNMISLLPLPMKQQIFNYIKYLSDDKKMVELKKALFKELLVANCKMLNCANLFNEEFSADKEKLAETSEVLEQKVKEITVMYKSLKNRNVLSLPFNFKIDDMDQYDTRLKEKKKELLKKQNELVEKYKNIKKKEEQFYTDREQIMKNLHDKYELHQTIYESSQNALTETNNVLKNITITNAKKFYK